VLRVGGWVSVVCEHAGAFSLWEVDDVQRRDSVIKWVQDVATPWLATEHLPAPGSELADDDKVEPRVSELARFGLVVAIDHLGLVVDALVDGIENGRPFRVLAPFTVLRASLLTAVRTKWLLMPDSRKQRQFRALRLEYQNQKELRAALGDLTGKHLSEELNEDRDKARRFVDERIETLESRALEFGPDYKLTTLPDTVSMIPMVVDKDSFLGMGIRLLWRTGSATVHGYHWASILAGGQPGEFSERDFNQLLLGSTLLTKEALKLYERRAGFVAGAV